MFLSKITLKNFRNYEDFLWTFKKNVLFLVGPNASGKTNFLEGVRVLSLSRSFRARGDGELIQFNKPFTRLEGEINQGSDRQSLAVVINCSAGGAVEKSVIINNKPVRLLDLVGKMTTVLFNPDDLNLVSASPSQRRRYLDITICQISPSYCRDLNEYRKVVSQRNQLLWAIKAGRAAGSELIFWDEKLIELGVRIIQARRDLEKFYNRRLSEMYGKISQRHEDLRIKYQPGVARVGHEITSAVFRRELAVQRNVEIEKTNSLIGPHRDDFILYSGEKKLVAFASRGEIRSAIIALKFAELDFFEQQLGNRPILLLDDIFSELDEKRRSNLVEILAKQQTIVTTTDLDFIDSQARNIGEVLKIGNS